VETGRASPGRSGHRDGTDRRGRAGHQWQRRSPEVHQRAVPRSASRREPNPTCGQHGNSNRTFKHRWPARQAGVLALRLRNLRLPHPVRGEGVLSYARNRRLCWLMFLVENTNGLLVNVHGADATSSVRIYRGGQFAGKPDAVAYCQKILCLTAGHSRSRSRLSAYGEFPEISDFPSRQLNALVRARTLCVHFVYAWRTPRQEVCSTRNPGELVNCAAFSWLPCIEGTMGSG
jgi:hypothetical protein